MDVIKQGSITLMKSAITGEAYPLPDGFDLEAAYHILAPHHMDALIYAGAVHCGISRNSPIMKQLFQKYCRHLLISEGQLRQIERITTAFEENSIDYLPLKGCRMKHLYPKPELRNMGDADILIRTAQYPLAVPIMESLGFKEGKETDHELQWHHRDLMVELHKRLIPSNNEDFCEHFGIGWQMASQRQGHYWSMSEENEWIFLFTHFTKHFRKGGIGCRHLVDLWVYLRNHTNMDESLICNELKKMHLLEFYQNIRNVIAVWFEDATPDEKTVFITDYIFSCGSWGNLENHVLYQQLRNNKTMSGASNKLIYFWRSLFPDVRALKEKYPILKKAPWTLPAVWIYRLFYKLLFEPHRMKHIKGNMDVLTTEKLQSRKQLLNYLGLEAQFELEN